MPDQADAIALVTMAQKDLVAMRYLIKAGLPDPEIVGFHAQQACEKCLKAMLAKHGITYPFTHNLGLLFELLKEVEPLEEFVPLKELTPFAVAARYLQDQSFHNVNLADASAKVLSLVLRTCGLLEITPRADLS